MNTREAVLLASLLTVMVAVPVRTQSPIGGDGAAARPPAPVFDVDRLEITPDVVRRFAHALRVEDSLSRVAARLRSPAYHERYQTCARNLFATDREVRRLSDRLRMEAAEFSGRTRGNASPEEYADFQSNVLEVYSLEIETRKEMKCGPAPQLTASDVAVQSARAGRFTPLQLRRLRERVVQFCDPRDSGAAASALTAGEAGVLRPRCQSLLSLLGPGG